jgi:hypothetical protein
VDRREHHHLSLLSDPARRDRNSHGEPGDRTNFTLAVSPAAQTVAQGSVSSTISITRTNWTGTVALSTTGLPANATASFGSASTSGASTTMSITTSGSTPTGTYTIDVVGNGTFPAGTGNGNGNNGNGVGNSPGGPATRYAAFTLTVLPPFPISGSLAAPLALGSGNAQSLDLLITNPYSTPLTVSNIQAALTSVQQTATAKGTCNQSSGTNSPNFQVTNLPTSYQVTVPANSSARLSQLGTGQKPKGTWLDQPGWAQNGCLGATLNFGYSGSGSF